MYNHILSLANGCINYTVCLWGCNDVFVSHHYQLPASSLGFTGPDYSNFVFHKLNQPTANAAMLLFLEEFSTIIPACSTEWQMGHVSAQQLTKEKRRMKRSCLKRKSVASNLHVNDDVPEQSVNSYIPRSQNMPGILHMYSHIFRRAASGLTADLPGPSTL